MKILVVGSGGREHALCWKIAQSPLQPELLCAPGNVGTAELGRNVAVAANDVPGLVKLALAEKVDLVVIGPEEPLVLGLADQLRAAGVLAFGPGAKGARIEGSKAYSKELLERHRIPCAADRRFDRSGTAKSYLESCTQWPQVVKADGLAAGKGVFICADARAACQAVDDLMEKKSLGSAGHRVVIEEFLGGEEASVLAITDGETILILEPVQDHKRVGDGDTGPNTGGMGIFSPIANLTRRLQRQIEQRVLVPTVHALKREEIEYRGTLFTGLMMTEAGPRVLEFNARFGDPETEALMRRMKSDLVPILVATAKGELASIEPPEWDEQPCVGVVLAAEGYPGTIRKGDAIRGLEDAAKVEGVVVFHAGTARSLRGDVVTAGGRVLCVTAVGKDMEEARARAYEACDKIQYDGKLHRKDIGVKKPAPLRSHEHPEAEEGDAYVRRRPRPPFDRPSRAGGGGFARGGPPRGPRGPRPNA
ncbi:MAG: phosphoribosylamine--glycine ligase [Planctomycetes bacterium]|nr:phosphoribosylamine--glycine ligase [Planctomycetota bacterium]